jgi:Tol biopolymer transport system component
MKRMLLANVLAAVLLSSPAFAERKYSDWGPPVNLGCGTINSPANDLGPAISKDGLSLYFTSARAGGFGDADLYVVQRPSATEPWGLVQNLGSTINTAATDSNPAFSRDGHLMFFNSGREGGFGDIDLWASYREHVHDDFAWQPPFNLGAGVNAPEPRGDELYQFQAGAGYFENEGGGPQLYFNIGLSQAMQGTTDIYVADLLPEGFGNRRPVPELNSPQGEQRPSIRFDGLEIFFFSNRPGLGGTDLWVATRESVDEPWNTPQNLGPVINSTFGEFNPYISADGLTLYFASNRPAGHPDCGLNDLYMTTRTKLKGNER